MTSAPPRWATAVAPIGPVAVGTQLWHAQGKVHLMAAVKARLALRHDAPMVLTGRPRLVARDTHQEDDPTRSLVDASDLVPFRTASDVWLVGHAYPPSGRPAAVSVAQLALYRGDQLLLLKKVHVLGDRSTPSAAPEPFDMMPLVYERAYGGINNDDNPVGVGADERPLQPNLVYPDEPERVACFGPVSRYWWLRRQHITTSQRRALEGDPPRVPDGLDGAYFQAAPADQRVPFLSGDEWIILDGMHPSVLRVRSRLPKVTGLARMMSRSSGGGYRGRAIAMVADTLAIDADAQICVVTWRGSVVIEPSTPLRELMVAGGVEMPDRPVDWSLAFDPRYMKERREAVALPPANHSGVTLVSDLDAPSGVMDELLLDDPLSKTTVDPHRPEPLSSTDEHTLSYRRVSAPGEEVDEQGWPTYPLAADADEQTETKTTPGAVPSEAELPDGLGQIPFPVDTEPVGPPTREGEAAAWEREPAVEPKAGLAQVGPPRPRQMSLPPAPLDRRAYADALRGAGASEEDINDWLASDDEDDEDAPPTER